MATKTKVPARQKAPEAKKPGPKKSSGVAAKITATVGPIKDAVGYKGHKPGSRKEQVHKLFDEKGPEAAEKFGIKEGLAAGTMKSWFGAWGRKGQPSTPGTAAPKTPQITNTPEQLLRERLLKKASVGGFEFSGDAIILPGPNGTFKGNEILALIGKGRELDGWSVDGKSKDDTVLNVKHGKLVKTFKGARALDDLLEYVTKTIQEAGAPKPKTKK